jgi:NAD+ synthase (glutamine-hydrolysing)
MKVTLAQQNFVIGDFQANVPAILNALNSSRTNKSDLVVFPELAISGYPPKDLLHFDAFIQQCESALQEIATHTEGLAVIIGLPVFNHKGKGKRLFNAAAVIQDKKVTDFVYKTLLPTYDIFDEYRYFEPNESFKLVDIKGKKVALSICEDIWYTNILKLYDEQPMAELSKLKPDIAINIAASPFSYVQHKERHEVLSYNAKTFNIPLVYVNQVGAQTDLIFDGGSAIYNEQGKCVYQAPWFSESFDTIDLHNLPSSVSQIHPSKAALQYQALVFGIKEYFQKLNFKQAIIGLSGGIDSALVAVLAAHALGKENVLCVLMPSQFSSDHSVSDAEQLAKNLGVEHLTIPIKEVFDSFMDELEVKFKGTAFGLAEENLQSRIRGNLLMSLSNKLGHILLNTSNKSELAVGYGTMYGDMAGGLSVIGDVYKTEVFELCRFINKEFSDVIPENIITKAPSAELRPDQKDTDSLPEYDVLDAILFQYIENNKSLNEIIQQGFSATLVQKTIKLVNQSEYKRHQTPPILRVSPRAFGPGRRLPIVGRY